MPANTRSGLIQVFGGGIETGVEGRGRRREEERKVGEELEEEEKKGEMMENE